MSSHNGSDAGESAAVAAESSDRQHSGFVCLVGPTNAGKSTLMNALVGEKIAIITPKPQTTRNRILGFHTVGGKGQIVFVDTPGLHRPRGRLGQRMVDVAERSVQEADLAMLVVDVNRDVSARGGLGVANAKSLDSVMASGVPVIIALNQIDRLSTPRDLLPLIATYSERSKGAEVVPVSAVSGDGLERLEALLFERLPEGVPLYPEDLLSDQAERFLASEIVREKVILATRDELPYAVAVEVESWQEPERKGRALRISAVIHVERKSQKGIVIGKGGQRLKQIGTLARKELEQFFATKVFLELFVRVEKDWTKDPRRLDRFGY